MVERCLMRNDVSKQIVLCKRDTRALVCSPIQPENEEMFVDSLSLVHSGEFSLQQNKEVVYSGFDFPSELEVKKKKKVLLGTFWREIREEGLGV
ncbi:hypothetical protein CDAR_430601 [Caerostris darwini]|uniref:Uncharacterized protein n=1 Tax=Caerostris darwini TaxID=1538125 RepID=A0AAV4Q2R1_9ARAC|nr:hypothetical protein CDAR_430601 [Caerostris darwini]